MSATITPPINTPAQVLFASLIGTTIEFFDFYIYGTAAVLVFPQLFFPADVMFIFSTFRDRLRILTLYDHDAFAETFHDELFAPFLVHLGKLANLDFGMLKTRDGFAASWQDQPSQRVTSSSQHSAHEP